MLLMHDTVLIATQQVSESADVEGTFVPAAPPPAEVQEVLASPKVSERLSAVLQQVNAGLMHKFMPSRFSKMQSEAPTEIELQSLLANEVGLLVLECRYISYCVSLDAEYAHTDT